MNEKENKQQVNKPSEAIEDLTVNDAEAEEIKGGPIYMKIDGVDGDVTAERTTSTGGTGTVFTHDISFHKMLDH